MINSETDAFRYLSIYQKIAAVSSRKEQQIRKAIFPWGNAYGIKKILSLVR